jgi:hypothetical protein
LQKFVKHNKTKIEKGTGFTRYLLVSNQKITGLSPIEYFYLEEPSIPEKYFPLNVYGIYDRITIEEEKIPRLKEDIIKILGESKKFGVWVAEENEDNGRDAGMDAPLVLPNGEAVNQ